MLLGKWTVWHMTLKNDACLFWFIAGWVGFFSVYCMMISFLNMISLYYALKQIHTLTCSSITCIELITCNMWRKRWIAGLADLSFYLMTLLLCMCHSVVYNLSMDITELWIVESFIRNAELIQKDLVIPINHLISVVGFCFGIIESGCGQDHWLESPSRNLPVSGKLRTTEPIVQRAQERDSIKEYALRQSGCRYLV